MAKLLRRNKEWEGNKSRGQLRSYCDNPQAVGDVVYNDHSGDGEKWSDSGYSLEIMLRGNAE